MARAGELLDAAAAESTAIVDGFARGDVRTALPKLGECCQTWSQVHLAICNSVSMLHLDPSRLEVDGRPLVETLRVPFDHLQHIKKVLEDRDFVLLSDILTYEFPEALAAWRKTIEALTAAAV